MTTRRRSATPARVFAVRAPRGARSRLRDEGQLLPRARLRGLGAARHRDVRAAQAESHALCAFAAIAGAPWARMFSGVAAEARDSGSRRTARSGRVWSAGRLRPFHPGSGWRPAKIQAPGDACVYSLRRILNRFGTESCSFVWIFTVWLIRIRRTAGSPAIRKGLACRQRIISKVKYRGS